MRSTSRLCTQQRTQPGYYAHSVPATWLLGVRTVHTTQFCDPALFKSLFGSLFMNTVHRDLKKIGVYKFFLKKILVYDLIYVMFTLPYICMP